MKVSTEGFVSSLNVKIMIDQQIYSKLSLLDSEQLKEDLLNYLGNSYQDFN